MSTQAIRIAPAVIAVALVTLAVACGNDGSTPTGEQGTGATAVHQTTQKPTEHTLGTAAPVGQESPTAAPTERARMDEADYKAWVLAAVERGLTITEDIGGLTKSVAEGEVSESFARSLIAELAREYERLAEDADVINPPEAYEERHVKLSRAFQTYASAAHLTAQEGPAAAAEVDRLIKEASQLLSEGTGVPLPE